MRKESNKRESKKRTMTFSLVKQDHADLSSSSFRIVFTRIIRGKVTGKDNGRRVWKNGRRVYERIFASSQCHHIMMITHSCYARQIQSTKKWLPAWFANVSSHTIFLAPRVLHQRSISFFLPLFWKKKRIRNGRKWMDFLWPSLTPVVTYRIACHVHQDRYNPYIERWKDELRFSSHKVLLLFFHFPCLFTIPREVIEWRYTRVIYEGLFGTWNLSHYENAFLCTEFVTRVRKSHLYKGELIKSN